MISGIKLPSAPKLQGVTAENILADLDLLMERLPKTSFKNSRDVIIEKGVYFCKKYITTIIEYKDEDNLSFESLCDLYNIISTAIPNFIKTFKYSNRVLIIAYPNFEDFKVNDVYEFIMDEIQRVTVFLIRTFGIERKDYIEELVRDYVEMCIEYPNI